MATSETISPSRGHAPSIIDLGPGAAGEGYAAIDWRRTMAISAREGLLSDGSYAVTPGAGTREISIAANVGDGVVVKGDSVDAQGVYHVAPHSAAITLQHDAADATNPRNDLVVLEVLDSISDGGGSNLARVRIVKGTPNASAVVTDALGSNGTPSLPSTAIPLAVVNVDVGEGVLSTGDIDDRRYRNAGTKAVAGAESTTSTSYTKLTTADEIRNLVVPANGRIEVEYAALLKMVGAAGTGGVSFFLNGVQLKKEAADGAPAVSEVQIPNGADNYSSLRTRLTGDGGMSLNSSVTADTTLVTTGLQMSSSPITITHLAAGIYDLSVRYKAGTGGTLTVKDRTLWARVLDYVA